MSQVEILPQEIYKRDGGAVDYACEERKEKMNAHWAFPIPRRNHEWLFWRDKFKSSVAASGMTNGPMGMNVMAASERARRPCYGTHLVSNIKRAHCVVRALCSAINLLPGNLL